MGLNPDELKIPAFQRKKRLEIQARTPLAWTALDRQKQGLEKEFVKAISLGTSPQKAKRKRSVTPTFQRIVLDQPSLPVVGVSELRERSSKISEHGVGSGLRNYSLRSDDGVMRKYIFAGVVEDTLSKISVAILQLSKPLSVGNKCLFECDDMLFEEDISSMQINHKSVKKAKNGDVIGMKISRLPKKGSRFYLPTT